MIMMPIELYTDGSCLKNPGSGGYGYIIRYYDQTDGSEMPQEYTIEFRQGYRLTTNNRMEIMAAIEGVNKIISLVEDLTLNGASQLDIFSDSEYLCNSINKGWIDKWQENNWMTSGFRGNQPTPIKNKDLWEKVIEFRKKLKDISVNMSMTWVQGHADNKWNERADQLAVEASHDTTNHLIDTTYEQVAPILNRR